MRNIFTICYSEEEANEIGHFIMRKGYEGVQNDSYRYCREAIWWPSNKLGDIIQITSMLALEVARWSYLGIKSGFAETVLNISRRNGCSMNY